jgi:hypothetical protein
VNIRNGIRKLIGKDSDTEHNVDLRRRRAILLRRVFPPDRPADTVGHFGGLPPLPQDIDWPRDAGSGMPMMFVAAIDLARLPGADADIGMPENGMLLFFVSADGNIWGDDGDPPMGHVVFLPGGAGDTTERSPPADAPPCFGDSWMYAYKRIAHADDAPRSFDRWPIEARARDSFCSILLDPDQKVPGLGAFIEETAQRNLEAAYAAYGRKAPKRRYHEDPDPLPPATYPQFWRMIGAAVGEIRFSTAPARRGRWDRPSEGELARDRAHAQAHEEAKAWAAEARMRAPLDQPSKEDRLRFRDWIADLDSRTYLPPGDFSPKSYSETILLVSGTGIKETMDEALDDLIALDPAKLRAAMPEAESLIEWRHAVIIDEMGDKKVVEHQMLGWGAEVQDVVSRRKDDVLLLQLDSDYGIRWMWGDLGVIQFWITPDDLANHRFDRVVTTFAGH